MVGQADLGSTAAQGAGGTKLALRPLMEIHCARVSRPKHPRRLSQLGAMRILDEVKWERTIREAISDADGIIPDAAEALGLSTRQLYRLLTDSRFSDVDRAPPGEHRD